MAQAQNFYDITIVGGGPVGGALACLLAGCGFTVHVIDKIPLQSFVDDQDSDCRGIAVSPSSMALLRAIEVEDSLQNVKEPIWGVRVLNKKQERPLDFSSNFNNGDPLGYIVGLSRLRSAIAGRAASVQSEDLLVWTQGVIEDIQREGIYTRVVLEDGRIFETSLLVGADGRHSAVRSIAGFETVSWPYGKNAIVCTYQHSNSHDGVAWEIFLEEGPLALLPMPSNCSSLVWSLHEDIAHDLMNLPSGEFDAFIQTKVEPYIQNIKSVSRRWSYPLSLHWAKNFVKEGIVLVGDAAHGMHPLAGQGLNMGFRDVAALAEVLIEAASCGLKISDLSMLSKYERWRRFDTLSMTAITHGLEWSFSKDSATLQAFCNFGLKWIQKRKEIRKILAKSAMGTLGRGSQFLTTRREL